MASRRTEVIAWWPQGVLIFVKGFLELHDLLGSASVNAIDELPLPKTAEVQKDATVVTINRMQRLECFDHSRQSFQVEHLRVRMILMQPTIADGKHEARAVCFPQLHTLVTSPQVLGWDVLPAREHLLVSPAILEVAALDELEGPPLDEPCESTARDSCVRALSVIHAFPTMGHPTCHPPERRLSHGRELVLTRT